MVLVAGARAPAAKVPNLAFHSLRRRVSRLARLTAEADITALASVVVLLELLDVVHRDSLLLESDDSSGEVVGRAVHALVDGPDHGAAQTLAPGVVELELERLCVLVADPLELKKSTCVTTVDSVCRQSD